MKASERLAVAGLLALVLATFGCAEVAPWERGHLAQPQMALEPHPLLRALRSHTYMSREAATSGEASSGSACGCY